MTRSYGLGRRLDMALLVKTFWLAVDSFDKSILKLDQEALDQLTPWPATEMETASGARQPSD